MKKICAVLCLMFLVGGNACKNQDSFRGPGGASAPPAGHRPGPPPEAFKACEGKTAGSPAQFVTTVTGTCEEEDGKLVLRPERPLGPDRDGHRGPPPEAFKACEGKTAGSAAELVDPRGETVKGKCEDEDGKMVLRPDRPPGNDRDGRRGPPPEAFKACEGKSAGSSAEFVEPRGEKVKGKCEDEDGKMVLRPNFIRGDRPGPLPDRSGELRGDTAK